MHRAQISIGGAPKRNCGVSNYEQDKQKIAFQQAQQEKEKGGRRWSSRWGKINVSINHNLGKSPEMSSQRPSNGDAGSLRFALPPSHFPSPPPPFLLDSLASLAEVLPALLDFFSVTQQV